MAEFCKLHSMEIWKSIEGYEGNYEISNTGKVKSLRRSVNIGQGRTKILPEFIMSHRITPNGYPIIGLRKKGIQTGYLIHRLVCKAFIPNPLGYEYVNHKDGNKQNNSFSNLEWTTPKLNTRHAWEAGLCGGRRPMTDYEVRSIRGLHKFIGLNKRQLTVMYETSHVRITKILNG